MTVSNNFNSNTNDNFLGGDMEDIKNKPVEIFQVDGTSLYEVAYLGDRQYLLYKVYSPWLGFFNWIPYVHLRRDAQSIHEDIALNYIYKREVKKRISGN